MAGLAGAVAALHANKFLHRDIKGDNLVLKGKKVQLIDLDTVREMSKGPETKEYFVRRPLRPAAGTVGAQYFRRST